MSRVGVIGATGFIGSQLVEHLLAQGDKVTCFLREQSDLSFLKTLPCDLQAVPSGDWRDVNGLARRFGGMERAYNCSSAGAGHYSMEYYREHEVERTRRIARAAALAGVARFVQLSTVWYHGAKLPKRIEEKHKPTLFYGPVQMFVEREAAVLDVQRETGLACTTVRPASVVAPRDTTSFVARLLDAYLAGRMPLFARGKHIVSLSDGRDTVDAIRRLSLDGRAANQTYLHASCAISYEQLRAAFAAALGDIPQRRTPSARLVKLVARLRELTTPYGRALPLTRFGVAALSQDVRVDDAKIRALGILPRHDFTASQEWAIARMARESKTAAS